MAKLASLSTAGLTAGCCPRVTVSSSALSARAQPLRMLKRSHQCSTLDKRQPLCPPRQAVQQQYEVSAAVAVDASSSPALQQARQLFRFPETKDFKELPSVVADNIKYRQKGLLGGSQTLRGADAVRNWFAQQHDNYQDLKYTINTCAEEDGKVAVYWTAEGVNRVGVHGQPATFKRSAFSGVSLVRLGEDGRINEVIEFRQPTREEMSAYLDPKLCPRKPGNPGHLIPCEDSFCLVADLSVQYDWRNKAVTACTEWVENWTAGPDIDSMVREDMEEFNSYSWPDFEADLVGKAALNERLHRPPQEAVAIQDTVADSGTSLVAVYWAHYQPHEDPEGQEAAENPESSSTPAATGPAAATTRAPAAARALATQVSSGELPKDALPTKQPSVDQSHGKVEMVAGQLRVHLPSMSRRSTSSVDEGENGEQVIKLQRVTGITLFQLDESCRIAWLMTFRELTTSEKMKYMRPEFVVPKRSRQLPW